MRRGPAMIRHPCRLPGCEKDAAGIFCPDHYFKLQPSQARWLNHMQAKIARCDDEERTYWREQLHGYIAQAIRTIQNTEALTSSQAALDSTRRQSSSQAAGVILFRRRM